jgi:hypothetical protein
VARRLVFPSIARLFALSALALPAGRVAAAEPSPVTPSSPAAAQPETKKPPKKQKADAVDKFFARGPVPRLRIEITPEDLNKLRQKGREYVTATVRELSPGAGQPDVVYEKVAVHLKGGAGSYRGPDDKPGLTLNLDKFSPGQEFHGLEKVHLNNVVQDPSFMSENLGNHVFRDAGIPAARVTYARVWMNERDLGLFVLKEGFDDVFLKRFFKDHRGALYEGPYRDVDPDLPVKANPAKKNPARLAELIAAVREGDAAARRQKLEKILDVDRFLTFMAVEAMTAHWDGYCPNRNNYRIYDDPKSGKLVFLPHGTDQLFQRADYPLMHGNAMVAQALSATPEDKAKYLERVAELRQSVFTPEKLGARLDEISARLLPVMEDLGADGVRRHKEQTDGLRQRIAERVKNIDKQLASAPRPLKFDGSGVATLAGAAWEPQNAGGNVKLDRPDADGRRALHLRVDPAGGDGTASFRTTVLLPRGKYAFEGACRTKGVAAPEGPNTGAGLRISGGQRTARLTGDADSQPVAFEFEVAEESRNVVLVCELKARAGEAWFDAESLKLRRR